MSRPLRRQVPNGYFHVGSRGNARREIFLGDEDRRAFLLILRETITRWRWRCVTYCLMGNHYHLLLQTPEPNLSEGMRDLNSVYARRFHREHGTDGSLFRPRFWSQLVQDREYLVAASRYIALNPVRAGLVRRAADWPWSSHGALVTGDAPDFLDASPLLTTLDPDPDTARRRYAELIGDPSPLPKYEPDRAIAGSVEFVQRHAPRTRPPSPVLKAPWKEARPELAELRQRLTADELICRARNDLNYTLAEIAAAVGCSTETVRRRLRTLNVRS